MSWRFDAVVMGLGYVGLPLAARLSQFGLQVAGFDSSNDRVSSLLDGRPTTEDVAPETLQMMLARGFRPTTDTAYLKDSEVVFICVPTPLSSWGGPDLGLVEDASITVAANLQKGQTVIIESTVMPGTTRTVVLPILESSGLQAGIDYHLGFSPERIDPGNQQFDIGNTPRTIAGLTEACRASVRRTYEKMQIETFEASGLEEGELSKLIENTYRDVNIALVNELARVCEAAQIDIHNAIDCASTKPFGFHAFRPGPGVGGHCIPIDSQYLASWSRIQKGLPLELVETARRINGARPEYVVQQIDDLLKLNAAKAEPLPRMRVLLLGLTYKPDIGDLRESPGIAIAAGLLRKQYEVSVFDPYVRTISVDGQTLHSYENLQQASQAKVDLAVLLQPHTELVRGLALEPMPNLLDACGALKRDSGQEGL